MAQRLGVALSSICSNLSRLSLSQVPLLDRTITNTRFQPQLQFYRHRRRTCKPPPWFVPKKIGNPNQYAAELTPANRFFLKDKFEEEYLEKKSSPLKDAPWESKPWTPATRRTGVLAVKIGVFHQWTKEGKKFPVTLLQVLDNHVIKYNPPEVFAQSPGYKRRWRKGWASCVVGALSSSPQYYRKEYVGLFDEAGVPPKRKLTRFLVTPDAAIQPGTPLNATHFKVGEYVDVQAKSIGHGFQGVVKRWGFKGGPASHGTTKWHRRPGSSAGTGTKCRVWKGKKMPGHMGMDWVHQRGLKIWRINTKYNVLYVHGHCLPGPTHCYVRVMDTCLYNRVAAMAKQGYSPSMPTSYEPLESMPEEMLHEDLHPMDGENIELEEAST